MLALVFAAVLANSSPAAATSCPEMFEGGVAPSAPAVVLICFTGFAVGDSPAWRDPAWSAEVLTEPSVAAGEAAKRNGNFHICPQLPAEDRSTPADYADSGYDLGHMTPAGDRGADKPETFGTCNMVPQRPNLNRIIWAGIEASLRNLAMTGQTIYVVTGPTIPAGAPTLHGRVAIPSKTWKAVYVVGKGAEAWDCTNTDKPVCVQETIVTLEAEIGFDPFPALGRTVEATPYALPSPTKGDAS